MQTDHSSQQCPACHKAVEGLPNFCPHCGGDLRGLTPLSDTLSGTAEGRVIDGRYRLKEKLGEGGMGAVYKVEHIRMGKVCALKLLRPEVATDKKLKSRFHQEARVVSRLSSPNTISVFDFGELDDGSLYIAMEYLSGRDLAWMLRAQGSFSEEKAVAIGIQVLSSLAEAHEQGIIHRDIKPANVMLVKRRERDDLVKVLDFGIAKLHESENRKHITGAADFIGTPAYMSPEQARGEALDARSDLYSVGAMLFELSTGKTPFEAPTPMGIVTKHLTDEVPRFQSVAPEKILSPSFENIVRKALAKDRKDRFASADEMRQALEKVHRTLGQLPNDFTPLPDTDTAEMARREDFDRFERSLKLRRTLLPLLTASLLALGSVYGWRYVNSTQAPLAQSAEVEDNNTFDRATPIALDQPVKGTIGPAQDDKTSDIDIYKLTLDKPSTLKVSLSGNIDGDPSSGIPDLNLVLEVVAEEHADGKLKLKTVALEDDGAVGEGESLSGLQLPAGTVYLRVLEHAYFAEAPRPPREKSNAPYYLTVSTVDGPLDAELEREPNDTPETAQKLPEGKPVLAFTGAYVPLSSSTASYTFSTADFFLTDASAPDVAALVVPPEDSKLLVLDGASKDSWLHPAETDKREVKDEKKLEKRKVDTDVRLLALKPAARGGYIVRVQPLDHRVKPGSSYYVVFAHAQEHGLDGVFTLAQTLNAAQRAKDAADVLELAADKFPGSARADEARAMAQKLRPVAADTP